MATLKEHDVYELVPINRVPKEQKIIGLGTKGGRTVQGMRHGTRVLAGNRCWLQQNIRAGVPYRWPVNPARDIMQT